MNNNLSTVFNILIMELDRFSSMNWVLEERRITPTVLLLPQTLKDLSELIYVRNDVLIECIDFLDILRFYSLLTYNDTFTLYNHIVDIMIENRTIPDRNSEKLVLNEQAVDDLIYSDKDRFSVFLNSNKFLVALFTFSLLKLSAFVDKGTN